MANENKYLETLIDIQENQPPRLAEMIFANKYYDIDISSRTIDSPEYLSVLKDHKAENVYFRINRYVDYMDLTTTTCIIQYENKEGSGIYAVPFYQTAKPTANDPNYKLIIPWCIDGRVTDVSGPVTYSIRFYKIDVESKKFLYSLNTTPAVSSILYGMDVQEKPLNNDFDIPATNYDILVQEINLLKRKDLYWIEYN